LAATLVPFIEDGVIPSRAIGFARFCLELDDPRAGELITRSISNVGYLGDHADLDIGQTLGASGVKREARSGAEPSLRTPKASSIAARSKASFGPMVSCTSPS
jgi:hypothetical protein